MKPVKQAEKQNSGATRCYLPMGLYFAVRNHPLLGIPAAVFAPGDMFDWRFRLLTFLVVLPWSVFFFILVGAVGAAQAGLATSPPPPTLPPPLPRQVDGQTMPVGIGPRDSNGTALTYKSFAQNPDVYATVKARAVAVVITCVVTTGMMFFSTLPVRLQRRGHVARYATPAIVVSVLISAACAGLGIYAAVDEAIQARDEGLPSPSFGDYVLHLILSLALPLGLDLLKWLGCVYVLAPTWWRGYNTRRAVDCYFEQRPFIVPPPSELEQEAAAGGKVETDAAGNQLPPFSTPGNQLPSLGPAANHQQLPPFGPATGNQLMMPPVGPAANNQVPPYSPAAPNQQLHYGPSGNPQLPFGPDASNPHNPQPTSGPAGSQLPPSSSVAAGGPDRGGLAGQPQAAAPQPQQVQQQQQQQQQRLSAGGAARGRGRSADAVVIFY